MPLLYCLCSLCPWLRQTYQKWWWHSFTPKATQGGGKAYGQSMQYVLTSWCLPTTQPGRVASLVSSRLEGLVWGWNRMFSTQEIKSSLWFSFIKRTHKVKPEQLAVLVVVDFTKLGTLTTLTLNKHCTLLAKVVSRNPGCYLKITWQFVLVSIIILFAPIPVSTNFQQVFQGVSMEPSWINTTWG